MRENRPYGSEGGEQRYCSPTPIDICARGAPLCLDPGLRRDDKVLKSRHIQSAGEGAPMRIAAYASAVPVIGIASFSISCIVLTTTVGSCAIRIASVA